MIFQLRQCIRHRSDTVVDTAEDARQLDFSRLTGYNDWSVFVVFNDGTEECIVDVNWSEASSYAVYWEIHGETTERTAVDIFTRKDCIVPKVAERLEQLYAWHWLHRKQQGIPVITVVPFE